MLTLYRCISTVGHRAALSFFRSDVKLTHVGWVWCTPPQQATEEVEEVPESRKKTVRPDHTMHVCVHWVGGCTFKPKRFPLTARALPT